MPTATETPGDRLDWIEGPIRDRLEREVLRRFLPHQRWYAGKARGLVSTRIVAASPPGSVVGQAVLAMVETGYDDGSTDLYLVPLTVHAGSEPMGPAQGREVCRFEGPEGDLGFLVDALADLPTCAALLDLIERGRAIETPLGTFRGVPTPSYAAIRGDSGTPLEPRPKTVEQSNSVVIFGDRLFLKVFRRLEPGLNPDLEIGRFLVEKAGFDRVPRTGGSILFDRAGAEPYTLAILQELVPNEGTGWEFALGRLATFYADRTEAEAPAEPTGLSLLALSDRDVPEAASRAIGPALEDARRLGRRTAELHRALASDPADLAFAPEPLEPDDLARIAESARAQVGTALEALRGRLDSLEGTTREQADRVLADTPGLMDRLDGLNTLRADATKIRVHGDYHLGQVLRSGDDYILLDFEGEPARPLEQRRAKQSPLKDLVGMIRSFDYAAYAGLFAFASDDQATFDRLAPWAKTWRTWTSAAFLRAYRDAAGDASFLPRDPAVFEAILSALTLEKALYELLYELGNRPTWVRIPLQGVLGLIESGPSA